MSNIAVQFDHVGKLYRLGQVGTGSLIHDLNRWWVTRVRGKEDPYLKIGETNDRSKKGESQYVWALRDITFDVEQGDVVGIIGRNGAGKSTLLKLLSSITSPTTGAIRTRGRIGSLLEVGTGFHPEMTGRENIYMNGSIMGMTRQEINRKFDEIVDFAGVERYIDTPVKRYSSGMTVRLGFAVAAFMEPEILVVDEVLAVGDAEFQKKAIGKMHDVSHGEGRTVLFVSHNMDSILKLCKKGVLLENGVVKYNGTIKDTVDEYINGPGLGVEFSQSINEAKSDVYISNSRFYGNCLQQNGLFSFHEGIKYEVTLKRKPGATIEEKTVLSVIIMKLNNTRVCYTEIPLTNWIDDEITFALEYKPNVLIPNKYLIRCVIHIPDVKFYDQQDTCIVTILDNGILDSTYKKVDNGIVLFNPSIEIR